MGLTTIIVFLMVWNQKTTEKQLVVLKDIKGALK